MGLGNGQEFGKVNWICVEFSSRSLYQVLPDDQSRSPLYMVYHVMVNIFPFHHASNLQKMDSSTLAADKLIT